MASAISNFFLNIVGKELCVLICSMIPIIELRGAIPLGFYYGLPLWESYLLSVLGNMIPVPFILLFMNKIMAWMLKSKIKIFNKFANFLVKKIEKNRAKIEKYTFFGLALFIAIPLPVTGAWTGSLVAGAIGIKFPKALLSALIGVLIAGVIVSTIVYGGATFLAWLI